MNPFTRPEVQQPGESLFKLPSELRLMIYEELFPPDTHTLTLYALDGNLYSAQGSDGHIINESTTILATCQTIYAEARPVLLANNEFRILIRHGKLEEEAENENINDTRFHTHFGDYWDDSSMFIRLPSMSS